jgi:cell division protein FtsL
VSSVAQSPRIGRPRAASASRARSERRPRLLGGGVVWIALFATLLAGVVAVNVAVLRLNLQLDGVSRERQQLKADIAELSSQLSSSAATFQIERTARDELGLVQADPDDTEFVRLPAR